MGYFKGGFAASRLSAPLESTFCASKQSRGGGVQSFSTVGAIGAGIIDAAIISVCVERRDAGGRAPHKEVNDARIIW